MCLQLPDRDRLYQLTQVLELIDIILTDLVWVPMAAVEVLASVHYWLRFRPDALQLCHLGPPRIGYCSRRCNVYLDGVHVYLQITLTVRTRKILRLCNLGLYFYFERPFK